MRVRRRGYRNNLRSGPCNRLIQIGEGQRYRATLGTPPGAFDIRAYETDDFEARGPQGRNVSPAAESGANNQSRRFE